MFKRFIPDFVYSDIYKINVDMLIERGIQAVFIDLDGTMASKDDPEPSETVKPFIDKIISKGIKVVVLSNNNENRVSKFCKSLGIQHISKAKKPFNKGIQNALQITGVNGKQVAIVGDQIYTDTFCGNRVGATTIYVESIDKDAFFIKLRYQIEHKFVMLGKKLMEEREENAD